MVGQVMSLLFLIINKRYRMQRHGQQWSQDTERKQNTGRKLNDERHEPTKISGCKY